MSKNGLSGPSLAWDPQTVGLLIVSVGPGVGWACLEPQWVGQVWQSVGAGRYLPFEQEARNQ